MDNLMELAVNIYRDYGMVGLFSFIAIVVIIYWAWHKFFKGEKASIDIKADNSSNIVIVRGNKNNVIR